MRQFFQDVGNRYNNLDCSPGIGELSAAYTNSSFTHGSSIDNIPNLYAKYCYDNGMSNSPILVVMHGYDQEAADFTEGTMERFASYGFFVLAVGMRSKDGASGTKDSSGRELHDIKEAIDYLRENFPSQAHPQKCAIVGYSGGGGNVLAMCVKFPDLFTCRIVHFGMSDYGYDATNGWYYTNTSFQANISASIGGVPGSFPNEYKSRSTLINNAIAVNAISKIYLFHDSGDASVSVIHSRLVEDAFELEDKENLVKYNESNSGSATRWLHALPNGAAAVVNSEAIWKVPALNSCPVRIPNIGRFIVQGYLITKQFELWLGNNTDSTKDGQNRTGILDYDLRNENWSFVFTPTNDGTVTTKILLKRGNQFIKKVVTDNSQVRFAI